jgi:demethylmenaquinone methyltransferase/2-methoxy-6-polyprenyl-1,4-benzoquinol methylase
MNNKFYQPDQTRAEHVNRLFTTIARRYDLLNDLMSLGLHRRWKRRLVAMAGQPRDVLDLCCGTGDIARLFDARVVGADFTGPMLQVAAHRQPAGRNGASHRRVIRWVQADALRLPFKDESFDVVSIGYGLRNLADINAGLRETHRVLRPGGKILSLDFGKPESAVVRSMYFGFLGTVLPILGWAFCGDADTHGYVLESLRHYPAQRGMVTLMQENGFTQCGFEEFIAATMAINYGTKPAPTT